MACPHGPEIREQRGIGGSCRPRKSTHPGDVALVGSTGTGAQKASQSAVGAGHVWVSATGSAPVTHAPSNYEIVLGGAIAYSMDHPEKAFFQRR
ncbi:alpha/beta hydrolase [Streptomyces noursei]|uniref:alpha/beta hydrolase n=1 Tax=Streptomyces noursei TaxID=1971 RepID=UPI0035AB6ABC